MAQNAATPPHSLLSPLLAAALSYARQGFHLTPLHHLVDEQCSCGRVTCRRGTDEKSVAKHPRLPAWQKHTSADEAQIRAWWKKWPEANIGIATGAISGIIVLDIDVHRDAPGFASLSRLEAELGPLPRTRTATTGSGGEHKIFKYPDFPVTNSAGWRGFPGIDWRADGGQIVAAPSVALAGQYVWKDLAEIAALSPAWLEALREHMAKHPPRASQMTATARKGASKTPDNEDAPEPGDDDVLLAASSAANSEKFRTLWRGNWQALDYESQSNADLALCSMLAFFCDSDEDAPDPDRIDRLFRRSGLYRDKWDRQDYCERTIAIAVEDERNRRAFDEEFARIVGDTAGASSTRSVSIDAIPPAPPSPTTPTTTRARKPAKTVISVVKRLQKIHADSVESEIPWRREQAQALGVLLSNTGLDAFSLQMRSTLVARAFQLIGFADRTIGFENVLGAIRDIWGKSMSQEDYHIGAIARAEGAQKRKAWEAKAPEREAQQEVQRKKRDSRAMGKGESRRRKSTH